MDGPGEAAAALSPSQSGTRSVYEKLQALALAENLSLGGADALGGTPPPPIDFADVAAGDVAAPADLLLVADNEDDDTDEGESTYEVTWNGGQLGLLFKADPADRAIIRRVNKKGTAAGLHYARAGDVLVALNGVSVERAPFLDVIAQLKTPQFPVRLEFRPLKISEITAASSFGGPSSLPTGASPTISTKTVDMTQAVEGSYVVVPRPGEDATNSGSNTSTEAFDGKSTDGGSLGTATVESHDGDANAQGEDDEYDVVWSEGPLGCELKQRNGLPTVKSVTGTGTTPSVAQIAAGDILVGINGLKTDEIGFKSTVTLMMRATKPVYLRFYRAKQECVGLPSTSSNDGKSRAKSIAMDPGGPMPTPLDPQQYTVLWKEGPLGIQIRTSSKGHVVVSRLTGAGDPAQLEQVAPGDIFVRIAGVEVDALGIAGAFDLLKTVKKPVVLVFQKRRSSSRRLRRPKEDVVGGAVPSFRQLREEWAQQQQQQPLPPRPSITRARSSGQQGPSRWSKLERAGSAQQMFAASYAAPSPGNALEVPPYMDSDAFSEGDISQRSYDPSDLSCDFPSPRYNGSIDADADTLPPPPAYTAFDGPPPPSLSSPPPPVFTDASSFDGDDTFPDLMDGAVPDLPPPPSYMDMFTQSGRQRDSIPPPPPPPPAAAVSADFTSGGDGAAQHSPRSDIYSVSSEMTPADYPQNPYGGVLPPSFDMGMPLPPPPEYTPGLGINNARTRLQELRRQYLESERLRNQFGDGYAFPNDNVPPPLDLDPPPPVPSSFDLESDAAVNLPAPELQIRWSEGPLGITFKRKHGRIVVSRLTGQGYSPGLNQLRPGDWLVSFNGRPTQDLRLSQTMELLKRERKPVTMCFVVQ
jgi:C-terminal processing protease CtpA/Prc